MNAPWTGKRDRRRQYCREKAFGVNEDFLTCSGRNMTSNGLRRWLLGGRAVGASRHQTSQLRAFGSSSESFPVGHSGDLLETFRPKRLPISRVECGSLLIWLGRSRSGKCALRVRFSRERYSTCNSNSWLMRPLTYARTRTHSCPFIHVESPSDQYSERPASLLISYAHESTTQ